MSPARLAADASGSGSIAGSVPFRIRAQLTGSAATAWASVAGTANTTGEVAIEAPAVAFGAPRPSEAAVAAVRSSHTLESGTHASAAIVPAAISAAVSAESCARTSVSTHRSGSASKSAASSATGSAIEVSATISSASISSHTGISAAARIGFRWPPTQR
ncbi:hypothetical protein GCM10025870_29780 [Agromyces marinus]|uniref:Uncharacterized protein n=1 Tax=Agromyces marinus TaxID=1389020 RepID=A0ABM8H525_9MICO|nr:hypothetical protein [Agromyces marinus]BDZ55905.1 hypothetical protein GCM10025870_29780 [Agromyces marinus]